MASWSRLKGFHTQIGDLARRIAELERTKNNTFRFGKINDIDEENWRVRVAYSYNPDGQPVLSDWLPWNEIGGNVRTWTPPTVGQYVGIGSLSQEMGVAGHSWVFPFGFTTEDGELLDTKAFVPPQYTRDTTRDTIEVIETRNTTGQLGETGAAPNQSQGEPGEKGYIWSLFKTALSTDTALIKKKQGEEDQQTQPHDECWKKREKGCNEYASYEQHKVTNEDVPNQQIAVTDQSPDKRQTVVQDTAASTNKKMVASQVETITKDGPQVAGNTGGEGLLPTLGWLKALWDGASPSGTGQNWFRKLQTAFRNDVEGQDQAGNQYFRFAMAGVYDRFTNIIGASTTRVRQEGASHTTTQEGTSPLHNIKQTGSGQINRQTDGDYINNALQRHVEHAGDGMLLGAGGALGISAGGVLSLGAGGVLRIGGNGVRIGGPVGIARSFIGYGGSMPGGGGSGLVNAQGQRIDSNGDPITQPDDEELSGDEYMLDDRLDTLDDSSATHEGRLDTLDEAADDHETRLSAVEALLSGAISFVEPGDIIITLDATVKTGFVELNGATITGGATANPGVASRYPWMVSGSNLVLPDMRGRFLRSWANGSSNDPDRASRSARVGGQTGDYPGTYQAMGAPAITGQFVAMLGGYSYSGAITTSGSDASHQSGTNRNRAQGYFDAADSPGTGASTAYNGNASEVRGINVNVTYQMMLG